MDRVSSSLTIILRIALPTIWLVTILSLVVLLSIAVSGRAEIFTNPIIWGTLLFIFVTGFSFIYFVLWRFYRVDLDDKSLYVSNYFRTFKYSISDIKSIRGLSTFPTRIFHIELKSKGTFGKHIHFLASQKLWEDYQQKHKDLMKEIIVSRQA